VLNVSRKLFQFILNFGRTLGCTEEGKASICLITKFKLLLFVALCLCKLCLFIYFYIFLFYFGIKYFFA